MGNWAGVTVERKSGFFSEGGKSFELVDLPGTYSLSAQSEDERIASSFLASTDTDLIINVLDASNLERNLFLSTQLLELNRPIIFVLNMMDDVAKKGIQIDLDGLSQLLGAPVIPTVGNRQEGLDEVKRAALRLIGSGMAETRPVYVQYGEDIDGELAKICNEISRDEILSGQIPPRWLALQLLAGAKETSSLLEESHAKHAISRQVTESRAFLESHLGDDIHTILAERRYGFVYGLVKQVLFEGGTHQGNLTEKLDSVLTHRWLGIPVFIGIMVAVYGITFLLGKYPQDWINLGFTRLRELAGAAIPPGELSSLVVDGIIPGVGAVVVFVPVIMLLMGCIAFLEDTGYMARAAFIMDRVMHLMGLHGKSFIPLLMGTGCNVPAIQATRTIESRADRLITILVSPLVSCSARLQVYIVVAGAFFPPMQAAMAILAMHFLGFGLAMLMGKLLRHTLFRRENTPFVMELPPYRLPVLKSTLLHMWEKGKVFLTKAGTVILAGATLIWFLSHYPGISNREWTAEKHYQEQAIKSKGLSAEDEAKLLSEVNLAHENRVMNSSLAAGFGKKLEPILAPILNPDGLRKEAWKDGVALTAGFVAKEIVVGTLGVVHQATTEKMEGDQTLSPLQEALAHRSGLTTLTAFAFMVFILIYTPCLGAVGMIYKETRSLGWTAFTLAYGLGLAWILSFAVIRFGKLLQLG